VRSLRYPEGTINLQKPRFKELGLDIDHCYSGTINLSIAPNTFEIIKPEFFLKEIIWKEGRKPENFLICRCIIVHGPKLSDGFVYYPDPSTKVASPDNPNHLQLLAPYIEGLSYGARLSVLLRSREIRIIKRDGLTNKPSGHGSVPLI
jgi:hypothetical protein